MPSLAYTIDGTRYAGRLTGRALVGRRLSHGVVLADPAVSRLHAWVDPTPDGTWAVTDAGSKGGTTVNGQPVGTDRRDLADGDTIVVGATRITFHASDALPPRAQAVVLTPPPGDRVHTSGVLFECGQCGSPIWVGQELVGKRGRCRHCAVQIVVPAPASTVEPKRDHPPAAVEPTATTARRRQCGVCHAAVADAEASTVCPECDTTYHAECWSENYGCSTYGCGQVNALDPSAPRPAPPPADMEPATAADDRPAEVPGRSRDGLVLLATALAAVVGTLLFGLPPLAMAAVATAGFARRRTAPLAAAVALGLIGLVIGLALSDWWWLGGAHLPAAFRR